MIFPQKKIIYLIEQPLDERNYERFGIQIWVDRGWNVEIWDITQLSALVDWRVFVESGMRVKQVGGYFCISSVSELKSRCLAAKGLGYFIDLTGDNYYSLQVKMRLIRMGAVRVVAATGSIPTPGGLRKVGFSGRVDQVIKMRPAKFIEKILIAAIRKFAPTLLSPGIAIVSGNKSIQSMSGVLEVIKAHNLDYDIYLNIKKSAAEKESGVVFIDQNLCFHTDFALMGMPNPVSPKKYFPALAGALRRITGALGLAICVAAHPKASYAHREHVDFAGASIRYGETAELVRDCSVVVCHYSTAIQMAVLFEKPIIFLTTDELDASPMGQYVHAFALELGKAVINIDRNLDKVDWQAELFIDHQKYARYRQEYIKVGGSPEKASWAIVVDHIEQRAGSMGAAQQRG